MQLLKPIFTTAAIAIAACSGEAQVSSGIGQYKSDIIAKCAGDGSGSAMCECVYESWASNLDDPGSPGALAAARIYSLPDGASPDPQDIMTGMSDLQGFGAAFERCVDVDSSPLSQAMGEASEEDGVEDVMRQQLELAGRGDLASVLGDGRYELEDLWRMDEIEQARRDREAAKEASLREAEAERMDDVYARRDASNEALLASDPTLRPVAAYEAPFLLNCQADGNDNAYCACKWSALLEATGGDDGPGARVAALMASVPAGDLTGIDGNAMSQATVIHGDYVVRTSDRCSS